MDDLERDAPDWGGHPAKVQEKVQHYLKRIFDALEFFCASAHSDETQEMEIDRQEQEEGLTSSVSAESLAKLLLLACDLNAISRPVAGSLPEIPPIQRDCDLPLDYQQHQDNNSENDGPSSLHYQRRRVDYLRQVLHAMAPLQLDVASHIVSMLLSSSSKDQEKQQTIPQDQKLAAWILFSVWLPVAPQISPLATHLFRSSAFDCPLSLLMENPLPGNEAERLTLMEATHRICEFYVSFLLDYQGLLSFWNWSPVIEWLPSSSGDDGTNRMDVDDEKDDTSTYVYDSNFAYEDATLWHTVRVVSYTLNLAPWAKADFVRKFGAKMYAERVPWVMHPFTVHREEYQLQKLAYRNKTWIPWMDVQDDKVFDRPNAAQIRHVWPLHPFLVDCGEGRTLIKYHLEEAHVSTTSSIIPTGRTRLVRTPTTAQNLKAIANLLCISPFPPPILVCGPAGAGKSSLIRELAFSVHSGSGRGGTRHDDYLLEIHVDEETDTKMLVGSYTTTDIPGEFAWSPGALTVAVRQGKWVLLEDLDSVPLDIQAALAKLLQDRLLPLGNGKVEKCHPNFRFFATLTTTTHGKTTTRGRKVFQEDLWTKVDAKPLPFAELKDIALGAHPTLPEFVVDAVLGIFRQLDLSGRENDQSLSDQKDTAPTRPQISSGGIVMQHGKPPSVRDLLKVMSRISNSVVFESQTTYATESQRTICLAETVDVFAGALPDRQSRRDFVRAYAAPQWKLTADAALQSLESGTPKIQLYEGHVQIGRVSLLQASRHGSLEDTASGSYACTCYTLRMMESIGVCIRENEPVLLVGETGSGKTSILQQLARICGQELVVQNLSLQTDSTDLLGGFKPLEMKHVARRLYRNFVDLFTATFSRKQNEAFLNFASTCLKKQQWAKLAQCFTRASKMGLDKVQVRGEVDPSEETSLRDWESFVEQAGRFEQQQIACDSGLAFIFSEGVLVEAIRKGKWILLDEINLASSETLQRLCGLLDDATSSITLTERGDSLAVERHPNFRIFAAMNPATDCGKKDLPPSMRSRFTEIHVDEVLEPLELRLIAGRYIGNCLAATGTSPENTEVVGKIVSLYLKSRDLADHALVDGSGHKPRYTLRTLTRALTASRNFFSEQKMSLQRALLEGFELTFQGSLDVPSTVELVNLFGKHLADGITDKERDHPGRNPGGRGQALGFVLVQPFWLPKGPESCVDWSEPGPNQLAQFVLTPTAKKNLRRLARAIASGPWPILLEGPTSSGKTTLVEYMASLCGHRVVRINNHEHTDIQEYTGGYSTDDNGKLGFQDGLLVQALRNGDWVILDELNLAPTEVLEALNRLLDDNRELYLAETNEVVKPHPSFRLFAAQNPSGAYGGRKPLSRAFRNRFLEIFVGDMPPTELVTILEKRAGLAPSHAKILVSTMQSLQRHRSKSSVFMGKDGFMTPRDLLRWAQRGGSSKIELAREGYMLLAERLRSNDEKARVLEEVEKQFKVKIDPDSLYYGESSEARQEISKLTQGSFEPRDMVSKIAPTKSLIRLLTLVLHCIRRREPVLLVGETGCGKTTVVQLIASLYRIRLHTVNCHATTETSDLIGGLRPVRGRTGLVRNILILLRQLVDTVRDAGFDVENLNFPAFVFSEQLDESLLSDDSVSAMVKSSRALSEFVQTGAIGASRSSKRQKVDSSPDCSPMPTGLVQEVDSIQTRIDKLYKKHCSLFEWSDGPLVEAMRNGEMILLDEMSLAEDAVLERLNSVLEPGRTLVLAEKGVSVDGSESKVVAHENFQFFATMNPGGDFGKRELSPALRSRFTEIWVPPVSDISDIDLVLKQSLTAGTLDDQCASDAGDCILKYFDWFNTVVCGDPTSPFADFTLSLRDILSWAMFIEACFLERSKCSLAEALYHGACLTHLDGLGLGTALSPSEAHFVKSKAEDFLKSQPLSFEDDTFSHPFGSLALSGNDGEFGIGSFTISTGPLGRAQAEFNFNAPTTILNLARILRGMRLSKPILLEGSPGVGKTTLIAALAAASGHELVRINLSEQTDMTDLLGSDMPVPDSADNKDGPVFMWMDGVLLTAIKEGHWVLLDELNLASQTVLEGLNSILDHRASVFIPEIGETISCPTSFRVFAAQNPLGQGGGRKGLPKSFLNRFIKVHVEALTCSDQDLIVRSRFPSIPRDLTEKMIAFNSRVREEIVEKSQYGHVGSPWEFNLRDIFRWCELVASDPRTSSATCHARDLYFQRLRTEGDRARMQKSFRALFKDNIISDEKAGIRVLESKVQVGNVTLDRVKSDFDVRSSVPLVELASMINTREPLEVVARCVERRWPCLLVGSSNSTKEQSISTLARLTNAEVIEVDLTASSDVSELLGAFEQADTMSRALDAADSLIRLALADFVCTPTSWKPRASKTKILFDLLRKRCIEQDTSASYIRIAQELWWMLGEEPGRSRPDIQEIMRYIENIFSLQMGSQGQRGRFEWKNGPLVQAMQEGHWIHLRNVNICPSSVLDRLNPVLEPDGCLLLLECSTGGSDERRVVKCHDNFRVFLSMDGENGEVSRAMRNRCVEVCFNADATSPQGVTDRVDVLAVSGLRCVEGPKRFLQCPFLQTAILGRLQWSGFCRGIPPFCTRAVDSSSENDAGVATILSSPRRTLDWSFNPVWTESLWALRLLQIMGNPEGQAADWILLSKIVPASFSDTLERVLKQPSSVDAISTRLVSSYFLAESNVDISFFGGLDHSLRETAACIIRQIEDWNNMEKQTTGTFEAGLKEIALNRIHQNLREANWYARPRVKFNQSVLRISQLLADGAWDRNTVNCPATPLFWFFFDRFDLWWRSLKLSSINSGRVTGLGLFVQRRDQLWTLLEQMLFDEDGASFGFEFSKVAVQWIWLRKASSVVDLAQDNGAPRALLACMASIDRVLLGRDDSLCNPTTLKWPVRPIVPRSPGVWKTWLSMKDLACLLSSRSVAEDLSLRPESGPLTLSLLALARHPAVVGVNGLKRDFTGAVSSFVLSLSSVAIKKNMTFFLNKGEEIVRKVTKQFHSDQDKFWNRLDRFRCELDGETMDNQPDLGGMGLASAEARLDDGGYNAFATSMMIRFGYVQLAPLFESFTNSEEASILRTLCEGLLAIDKGKRLSCSLESLKRTIARVIEVSVSVLPWTDLIRTGFWQSLLWALDQSSWKDLKRGCVAQEVLVPILSSFSLQVWSAPGRTLSSTSMDLEVTEELVCPTAENKVRKRSATTETDTRVPVDLTTDTVLRLLGPSYLSKPQRNSASKIITIENLEARQVQVSMIVEKLAYPKFIQPSCQKWEVMYLLRETFEALNGSMKGKIEDKSMFQEPGMLSEDFQQRLLDLCEISSILKSLIPIVVKPLLLALNQTWGQNDLSGNARAKWSALADIFLGLLRFYLLLPRSILDPGLKPAAKVSLMKTQIQSLETDLTAEMLSRCTTSGSIPACSSMVKRIAQIEGKIAQQKRKIIERVPTASSFADLYREFNEFAGSFLDANRTSELAQKLFETENDKLVVTRAQNVKDSWKAFCERSLQKYPEYEDVVVPLVGAVGFVARGFKEMLDLVPPKHDCNLSDPMEHHFTFPNNVYLSKNVLPKDIPPRLTREKWKCFLPLGFAELFRVLTKSKIRGLDKDAVSSWSQTVQWLLSSRDEGGRGDSPDNGPRSDVAAAEERYRARFPDHRKAFAIGTEVTVDESEVDPGIDPGFDWALSESECETLAWIHSRIFSQSQPNISDEERIKAFHFGYRAAAEIYQAGYSITLPRQDFSGAHFMAISLNTPNCKYESTDLQVESIPGNQRGDFQKYPSPAEAIRNAGPLELVMSRVNELLSLFPGNAVLGSVFRVTDRVRKLDALHCSPARLLAGLEELLKHAQDYEQHASRRVQIGEPLLKIRDRVADLRKRELESWPGLLLSREKECERKARKFWVRLYRIFQDFLSSRRSEGSNSFDIRWAPQWAVAGLSLPRTFKGFCTTNPASGPFQDLVKTLDTFILASPLGEVQSRLSMLRSFGLQFKVEAESHKNAVLAILSRTIVSLWWYYEQFSFHLCEYRDQLRQPFEERLKKEVKLAKWDQQSYYALTDTVERNYRKLMGIINEYDDVLQSNTSLVLEKYLDRGIKTGDEGGDTSHSTVVPSPKAFFSGILEETNKSSSRIFTLIPSFSIGWRSRHLGPWGSRLDNIANYAEKMSDFMRKLQSRATKITEKTAAEQLSDAVFDRIESLRAKNSTRAIKERALVDLFRELKRQGYSPMNQAVPPEFREFGEILHLPSPQDHLDKCSPRAGHVEDCELYLNRCLSELSRLRPESKTGSRHITQRQLQTMLGFAEHSVYVVIQQRTLMWSLLGSMADLSKQLDLLSFEETELISSSSIVSEKLSQFDAHYCDAIDCMRQLRLILEAADHLVKENGRKVWASRLTGDLAEWLEFASQCFPVTDQQTLITQTRLQQVRSSRDKLCRALQLLEESQGSPNAAGFIPDSCFANCMGAIETAVSAADDVLQQFPEETMQITAENPKEPLGEFRELCTKAVEIALVTAQECVKSESGEDDLILSCHRKACIQLIGMGVDSMIGCTDQLLSCVNRLSHQTSWAAGYLRDCSALSADVSLLCQHAVKLVHFHLDKFIAMSRSCAKLSYILLRVFRTLVARGFCSDKAEEDGGKCDGKTSFDDDNNDGTGMGEGEGQRDVTDEIENEEQLLGLKNENRDAEDANKDLGSKELDKEEAGKGMEMENDFDGDMYDVPDEPEDEDDGKEDKEELDRDMGDGPDDKEQVVDEKMWDSDDDDDKEGENAGEEKLEEGAASGQQKNDEMVTKDDSKNGQEKEHDADPSQEQRGDQKEAEDSGSKEDFINEDDDENKEESHGVEVRDERKLEDPDNDKKELDDEMSIQDGENNDDGSEGDPWEGDEGNATEDATKDEPEEEETMLDSTAEHEGAEQERDDADEDDLGRQPESSVQVEGASEEDPKEEFEEKTEDVPTGEDKRETTSTGLGVSATGGDDAADDAADEDAEGEQVGNEEKDLNEENEKESSGRSGYGPASHRGTSISHGTQADTQKMAAEKIPNPLQNLGDAKRFWHTKLNVIQSEHDASDGTDTNEKEDFMDDGGRGDYEYTRENEKSSAQTLGLMEDDTMPEELSKEDHEPEERTKGEQGAEPIGPDPGRTSQRTQNKSADRKTSDLPDKIDTEEIDRESDEAAIVDQAFGDELDEKLDDDPGEKLASRVVSDLSQLNVVDGSGDVGTGNLISEDTNMILISESQHELGRERWGAIQREIYPLARRLCEKLRLVMEPLVASKLRGDYRTGKRINMKRVLGYVASSYRKDKIWLRRTKPAKRNYRVLVAVDDSESMKKSGAGEIALKAMATLATGMSQLEVGEIGIASFGDEMRLVHPFHQPFTHETGVGVTSSFQFSQQRTRTALCVESAMMALEEGSGSVPSMQIVFLISDGRIERDSRSTIRRLIREMMERNILMAMIIVEGNEKAKDSIVNMKEVTFVNNKPQVKPFIEDYPFPYYVVLDDMSNLPTILCDALRQWFEMLARLQATND